jgi:hypothetical protein
MEQLALFGPARVEEVGKLRGLPPAGARWTAYKARARRQCDDRVTYLHEQRTAGQTGHVVRSARWVRRDAEGDRFICQGHADARKTAERV